MFDVGSLVYNDLDDEEVFVVVRINCFDTTEATYDIQSAKDGFVYSHVYHDRLRLASNQNLNSIDAYNRAMQGI